MTSRKSAGILISIRNPFEIKQIYPDENSACLTIFIYAKKIPISARNKNLLKISNCRGSSISRTSLPTAFSNYTALRARVHKIFPNFRNLALFFRRRSHGRRGGASTLPGCPASRRLWHPAEVGPPPFWQLSGSRPFLLRQRRVRPGASRAFLAVTPVASGIPSYRVQRET